LLIKSLVLVIIFLAITPTYAIFSVKSFLLLLLAFLILNVFSFRKKTIKKHLAVNTAGQKDFIIVALLILLAYSSQNYGGIYQIRQSLTLGDFIFSIFSIYVTYCMIIIENGPKLVHILSVFIFLGVLTVVNAPSPYVDTFYVFSEAPRQFIQGQNPYAATFSKIYENITPDYYNYLPFSFVFLSPFVLVFSDPRYAIIFAMFFSGLILYYLPPQKQKINASAFFVAAFLFLPRSFYMLEHVYFDTIIFLFFLLFVHFFYKRKNFKMAFLMLGLFYSFKQHFILTLPFLMQNKIILKKALKPSSLILFFAPFSLPLYYLLIDHQAFLEDVLFGVMPGRYTAPINRSLTLPTFVKNISLGPVVSDGFSVYWIGLIAFIIFYFLILKSKIFWLEKVTLFFFGFSILAYHGFFNSYYLVALFLLFNIACDYFNINLNLQDD